MLPLLLNVVASVSLLSAQVCMSAVATETVLGVAGKVVTLPCRLEAAEQKGVEVCWGRGEPSIFTCHNMVVNSIRDRLKYQRSQRYSVSSSSSLSILDAELADAGFYHCRAQLPGLFNDQSSIVHLIVTSPPPVVSERSVTENQGDLNPPATTAGDITEKTGNDVTEGEPVVALVQSHDQQQNENTLEGFVGNTLRMSFIIFIPALLLTVAYRVWRSKRRSETDRRMDQSEEEEGSSV